MIILTFFLFILTAFMLRSLYKDLKTYKQVIESLKDKLEVLAKKVETNHSTTESCENCKCYLNIHNSKIVETCTHTDIYQISKVLYYCQKCAPAYDRVEIYIDKPTQYFKKGDILVNKDGSKINPKILKKHGTK